MHLWDFLLLSLAFGPASPTPSPDVVDSSISFLDHCSFDDESLCQMSVCSASEYGWQRVSSVSGINVTDHTFLGKESEVMPAGTSFFMHFNTEAGKEGDSAGFKSRKMTPRRDCKIQCLQFYYYQSGSEFDQLNIWIREYQDDSDTRGTLRLMDQITGAPGNYWQLHHVPLNAYKTFQVEFEGRKGAGNSIGGFSLDDINISETECPHTWQIRNFEKLLNSTKPRTYLYSPLFYSSDGYRYQILLRLFVSYFYIYFRLVSGIFDDQLQWPCPRRQVTFQVLDQHPHIQKLMSYKRSITMDPKENTSNSKYYWDNPRKSGTPVSIGNETVYLSNSRSFGVMLRTTLIRGQFIKGGDIIFLFIMQDISALLQNDSLPCPSVTVKSIKTSLGVTAEDGPCTSDCAGLDIYCGSSTKSFSIFLIILVVLFFW